MFKVIIKVNMPPTRKIRARNEKQMKNRGTLSPFLLLYNCDKYKERI